MADESSLVDATNDATFPAVDVNRELHPGKDDNFKVDPVSSQVAKGNLNPPGPTHPGKKKTCAKKDPMQTLKTTIIVSGVILAVAGAVFAVTKKMKEK